MSQTTITKPREPRPPRSSPSTRAALAVTLAALAASSPASAATPADVIARLNAQRASNGMPAGIVERADWSAACARHNDYQRQNGLGHNEDPGRPGYTSEGAWAGQNSVLAGTNWGGANPFENAPIHLDQLLAPRLAEMGVDDSGGFACATTWPGMSRTPTTQATAYSYPADGRRDVPYAQNASESPFVPGDFVGLPQGTTTGPNILVFADGPWSSARARITAASLTGPDGPVEVRWVDNETPQIGPYLVAGGVVIPARPLRPASAYTASLTLAVGQTTVSRTWSFTTAQAPAPPPPTGPTPGGQPVQPTGGGQPARPGGPDQGAGQPDSPARLAQWIDLKRRAVRAGRSLVLRYEAADRGRITVRLVRRGQTYSRGSFTVARGERGAIRIPSGSPGRYKLRATLTTSRTTSFRATVTARR